MRVNNVIPQINTNSTGNKNGKVAFSGGMAAVKKSLGNIVQLERAGNMTRKLFTINAFAFLLSGRLITSRDKDEIRETATRDIPTIVISVFGISFIEKVVASRLCKSKKIGFALAEAGKSKADEVLTPVSYSQLSDWYKFDNKLASGFKGFTERLNEKGGNLKKIYSSLGDDMKAGLAGFSENNADFIKQLFDNKDAKNKQLLTKLEEMMSKGDNKALINAKWLKTIPTLVGFALTLSIVGIMIPKFNIALTEHINKNKKAKAAESQSGNKEQAKAV